ncbi:hypothetical protein BH11PLA2_BH11PLA2_26640 [soil metagenome]
MDLCGEELLAHAPPRSHFERLLPPWQRRFTRIPVLGRRGIAFNADRLWNRFRNYPRFARRHQGRFDLFHIVDHSYAQLVHAIPTGHSGVYCHDLDAFRCLLEPHLEPRPGWYRSLSRKILTGLQSAAIVFHNSQQTRDQILKYGLVDPAKLIHAPLGVAAEFTKTASANPPTWLASLQNRPWLLHVGSCIPRKRIDVLLELLAEVRTRLPNLQLLKIGGTFTVEQQQLIEQRKLREAIVHVTDVDRSDLAAAYRAAPLVVIPSESEGFGLPALEALACEAKVLASDIPALREAGGDAARYASVGDIAAWTESMLMAFANPESWPSPQSRAEHAAKFSWAAHAETITTAYENLMARGTPT